MLMLTSSFFDQFSSMPATHAINVEPTIMNLDAQAIIVSYYHLIADEND